MKKLLTLILTVFALVSCAEDIVDLTGSIQGVVKDYKDGQFISNCQVSLMPTGKTTTTDLVGKFNFDGIEPGEYILEFSKAGYMEELIKVKVVTGKVTEADIMLKAKSPFSLSETNMDFGEMETNKAVLIQNETDSDCTYSVKNVPSWLSLNPSRGTVPANGNTTVIFTVNREKADVGEYSQEISFDYTGKYTGSAVVSVRMQKTIAPIGRVYGVVKEELSGDLISNCEVSITPGGIIRTTDQAGRYEFADLNVGSYSLAFRKAGYKDASIQVTVVAGGEHQVDVRMTAKSPFFLAETSLDFGEMEINKVIHLYNESDADCTYSVKNVPSWLLLDPATGTVAAGSSATVAASVNRDAVNCGKYFQEISFDYTGKRSGSVSFPVSMEKVELSTPTVSCGALAENIEETSFDISGSVVSIGGQAVTSYGHCWSLSPEPTVSDNITNMGRVVAPTDFKSTITGLTAFTTYYVRAYAENAMGVSYSDEITVTTKDVKSDKWDGSKATSFAGGTGTFADPYIIKTGGHLLHMMDYPDKYYVLANNINLDNINWKPFLFSGTLDGKGFIISNLYIKRNDDNQGLFSKLRGTVKNLTIKGVKIDAESNNNIGAIAGLYDGGKISDCKVIFISDSFIKGHNNVGGIMGSGSVANSEVTSMASGPAVVGNNNVGGVLGSGLCTNVHVSADVFGSSYVGGVIGAYSGTNSYYSYISGCSFKGTVSGYEDVGGVIGYCYYGTDVVSCKSVANIIVESKGAGGICGFAENANIIACYADGKIIPASDNIYGLSGIACTWDGVYIYHSFSTVSCSSPDFDGISNTPDEWLVSKPYVYDSCISGFTSCTTGTNIQSYCTDITTFMKDCYSDYASYWNYNNTWTWKGTINGKEVSVSCPRLTWEQ